MSLAKLSLGFAGLFEAEVLAELLLWRWDHPSKNDKDFCNGLLEEAAAALQHAADGEKLFDELPAQETSLIAAIYFAEWNSLESGGDDPDGLRRKWLEQFRASIPSCFCSQSDLPP